jgi:competence protein ComEC
VGRFPALLEPPAAALAAARGRLFPFVPVALGAGIGLWFALPADPSGLALTAAVCLSCLAGALWLKGAEPLQPLGVLLLCGCLGFLAAALRAEVVRAPVLAGRYYGPVQGRVVAIDRSQGDDTRLTLDRVVLEDTAPADTPASVRVTLKGEPSAPVPGTTVILTAHLLPPSDPAEPGAFDFRRMAWFDGLGAVGYTSSPVLTWAPPDRGGRWVARVRAAMSAEVRAAVPGDAGAFAAGVLTGDRSALSQAAVEDLRDSNLAHLLAISGMNLAFLTGFVFALIRYGLALVPRVALRLNAKKAAAVVALAVAFFYLLLSGANVATERAFIMAAVMLGAVLLDRKAFTLRSVAHAALLILLWQPESLTEPGFQMSFAATVALIVGFNALQGRVERADMPGWALWVYTLVLSSVIGGVATAPFAAATFNRFADFGLVANLLTVPVMGAGVMGAGVVALLLWPFGLSALPLAVAGWASAWILAVADRVAGMDGAVTMIPVPGAWVIPVLTLGALWLSIWPGRARWLAVAPMAVALAGWGLAERPMLLISADGRLAGLLGPEGRALSAPRGAGFAAETWLARDGDGATQREAAARPGFTGEAGARGFQLGPVAGVVLSGRDSATRVAAACAVARLVILPEAAAGDLPAGCTVIDRRVLARTGALAVSVAADGTLTFTGARGPGRLWSGRVQEGVRLAARPD